MGLNDGAEESADRSICRCLRRIAVSTEANVLSWLSQGKYMIEREHDAYGEELKSFVRNGHQTEVVERDDGYIDANNGIPLYFAPYSEWRDLDKKAIALALGRVLDVGCGAGRISLHLQSTGHEVVAIDNSPGAIEVSIDRGVRDARVLSFAQVNKSVGRLDSLVLFGNNFGLFANYRRARWLLRRLKGIVTPSGRIIAEVVDPYGTDNPDHLAYQQRNRERGRMGGQLRIRIRHRRIIGNWFDYLFVSKQELESIVDGTGWRLAETLEDDGVRYFALLENG